MLFVPTLPRKYTKIYTYLHIDIINNDSKYHIMIVMIVIIILLSNSEHIN